MKRLYAMLFTLTVSSVAQMPGPLAGRNFVPSSAPLYTIIQTVASPTDGVWAAAITPGATGRLLVGAADMGNAGCTATTASVTDTAGNTWSVDKIFVDTGTAQTWMLFHAIANGTSSSTVTVHPNNGSCFHGGISVSEVSGVSTFDSPSASTASASTLTQPTLTMTTVGGGELCVVVGTISSSATFAPFVSMTFLFGTTVYQVVGGTSTGTSTVFTSSTFQNPWALTGACYK